MKKLILTSFIFIIVSICFGQSEKITEFTDLDIANDLIAKDSSQWEQILQTYEVEYWITEQNHNAVVLYITYDNSIRLWEIHTADIVRVIGNITHVVAEDAIDEIFVRYRHSNLNDLKHFNLYDKPDDTDSKKYEKKSGARLSHFRINQY